MGFTDNEKETEKLIKVLSLLQNIYNKKQEQLEDLQLEIKELHGIINNLNSIISNQSFTSADEIYAKLLSEEYFKEGISEEKFKGTNIKRKIFSPDEKDLLCVLNFYDFKRLEIKFIDPEIRDIKETSEDFINLFLKGALIKIKERYPNLSVNYSFYKNTDKIEYIHISNLNSIEDYDLITEKIRVLLASEH
ncbi:MAG: hypothetical protein ACFE8E_13755 [Candidatus Hodarchaeota archaeon]